MSATAAAANETAEGTVTLRGTSRGLEIQIEGPVDVDAVTARLAEKLEESPGFFAGGDATLRFSAPPPAGCLGPLEAACARYDLRIAAVHGPEESGRRRTEPPAEGSGAFETRPAEAEPDAAELDAGSVPPKMIAGPIRSGCVLEIGGHLIVVGDVNPGAEVRAVGSIVVLGRLRGIAHAGCGGGPGFILALELAPQQLRVGSLVARAGDADDPGTRAEIAYAKDGRIVVETYTGRLPWGIATAKF